MCFLPLGFFVSRQHELRSTPKMKITWKESYFRNGLSELSRSNLLHLLNLLMENKKRRLVRRFF